MLAPQGDEVVGVRDEDGELQLRREGAVGYVHGGQARAVDALVRRYRARGAIGGYVAVQAADPLGEPGAVEERGQVEQGVREMLDGALVEVVAGLRGGGGAPEGDRGCGGTRLRLVVQQPHP